MQIKTFVVTLLNALEIPRIVILDFYNLYAYNFWSLGSVIVKRRKFCLILYSKAWFLSVRFDSPPAPEAYSMLPFLLCVCLWRLVIMTMKQSSDGKKVRDLPVHLPACVLLLNVEVLPEFQVLDLVLPRCSPPVAMYHLHLYTLGKEKRKSQKQSNTYSCFPAIIFKPCSF